MRPNKQPDRKIFGVRKKSGRPYVRLHRFFFDRNEAFSESPLYRRGDESYTYERLLMKDTYEKGGGLRLKPSTFVWRSLKSSSVGEKAIKKTFFSVFSGYIPSVFR